MPDDVAELRTALTEDEARLHRIIQVPAGGPLWIIRKWEYIDATYADDLVKACPYYVTNPYADGQAFVGTYTVKNDIGEGQDDRTVTIFQRLSSDPGWFSFYSHQSALRDDRTYVYDAYPTAVAAPVDTQGQIYDATNEQTDDGLYNARLTAQLSTQAEAEFAFKTTAFRKGTAWIYENQRAIVQAPTLSTSGIYEVKGEFNPDGTYKQLVMYEGSTGAGAVEFDSLRAELRTDHTWLYKDRATEIAAPPDSQGTIYRADNNITEIATYNSQIVQETSVAAQSTVVTDDTYLATRTTDIYQNQAAPIAASSVSQGAIYDTANKENLDGTYDATRNLTVSKASEIYFTSGVSQTSTETTGMYQNERAELPIGSSSAGTSWTREQRLNPDGTYSGAVQKRVASTASAHFVSHQSGFVDRTTDIYAGLGSALATPTDGIANIYDTTNSINRDGSFDSSLVQTVSTPSMVYFTFNTKNGQAWVYDLENTLYADVQTYANLLPLYGSNGFSVGQNPDLTYNAKVEYRPDNGGGGVFAGLFNDWQAAEVEFRDNPLNKSQPQVRYVVWHYYVGYHALETESASWLAAATIEKQFTHKQLFNGLWRGTYKILVSASAWSSSIP